MGPLGRGRGGKREGHHEKPLDGVMREWGTHDTHLWHFWS